MSDDMTPRLRARLTKKRLALIPGDPEAPASSEPVREVREPRLTTDWRRVDWQSLDPPFGDVTHEFCPRRHRRLMADWRSTGQTPAGYQQPALPDQGTQPPDEWGYRLNEVEWTGFDGG